MTTTAFDKQNLREIRTDINIALRAVSEKYGIDISIGTIRFTAEDFRCKLEAKTRTPRAFTAAGPAANVVTGTRALSGGCTIFGLNAEKRGPKGERLVDYNPRRPKYPFTYETIRGTRYKGDVATMKTWFGA